MSIAKRGGTRVSGTCMVAPSKVDSRHVQAASVAGATTTAIALHAGVSKRRIQQLTRHLRPAPLPAPDDATLDAMIAEQRKRLGPNYGFIMMQGALRAANPGFTYAVRRINDALQRMYPEEHNARKSWAQLKLERGHYHAPHFGYSKVHSA